MNRAILASLADLGTSGSALQSAAAVSDQKVLGFHYRIRAKKTEVRSAENKENRMTKDELISECTEWLSRIRWNWWGTLAFRHPVSEGKAALIFKEWVGDLRAEYQTDNFRCFWVTEFGAYGRNRRFYILAGGLREAGKEPALLSWDELAGRAVLSDYIARPNGMRYVLRTLLPDRDLNIDFILRSKWR
jgi:hypothetical protein